MEESRMAGRLFRLLEIDRILSASYRGEDPENMMSVKEIYEALKKSSDKFINIDSDNDFAIHPKEEKTVRKDLQLFKDIREFISGGEEELDCPYQLLEAKKFDKPTGRMVSCFAIPPVKSFFRHNSGDWELSLFSSILEGLKIFDVVRIYKENTSFKSVISKHKISEGDDHLPPVVDLSVIPPDKPKFFSDLVSAITDLQELRIFYRKIPEIYLPPDRVEEKAEVILPLQIKRFGNRWVVIAMVKSNGYIVNFSFDQIEKLEKTGETFDKSARLRIKNIFKNVVGPTLPYEKSRVISDNPIYQPTNEDDNLKEEDVIFFALPERANHIAAFPVMTGGVQKEINVDKDIPESIELQKKYEKGKLFKLNKVYVTRELIEVLFKRMDSIVVLRPLWLQEKIKSKLNHLLSLY